ncbi:MAG: hypothetical protein JKY65_24435 [Planctomycetes bacterium]|nr:hypothetical protein [Planctomycetota bacterium]
MQFKKLPVDPRVVRANRLVERALNRAVRSYDGLKSSIGLAGRKARYDDANYEFFGGARDTLRAKHYDKSMRLLWKAEEHAPWLSFKDCTPGERSLREMALRSLTEEEQAARARIAAPEYKALLNREYTRREKQAIVNILSAIGHGEAYAWLVSAELLTVVESTGARAALTMQVLEEAKHFVVLRELLQAFEVPIPRQSAWEYMFMEGVYKASGLEKLFGMNVLVEGVALSLFGLLCELPGLEVLRLFHLDESRHTALPSNYLKEFPLSLWERHHPLKRWRRLRMVLPALGMISALEEDMAELGLDAFDFGGSVLRKISHLAHRNGFFLPVPRKTLLAGLNVVFNGYCKATRAKHSFTDFTGAETTLGARELEVEREIFEGVVAFA